MEAAIDIKPNFFFIGGMRCGSTSINSLLGQHPEIFMSPVKEPYYYQAEAARRAVEPEGRSEADAFENAGLYRSPDAYFSLFEGGEKSAWRGESSHYLYHPAVIPTILADCPQARFLVSFRNPVDRIFSEYLLLRRTAREDQNFDDFIYRLRAARTESHEIGPRLDKGLQGKFFTSWASAVPPENLHWILFDDFKKNPVECIQSVFDWLEVDSAFRPSVVHAQRGGIQRRQGIEQIFRARNFGARNVKKLIPRGAKRKIVDLVHSRTLVRPNLDGSTRRLLVDFYRDDVERLGEAIGRDLSSWLEPNAPAEAGGQ